MPSRDPKETFRRLLMLGSAITGVTKDDIEGLVRDLVNLEGEGRERLEELAEQLFARSRRSVERFGATFLDEVRREFEGLRRRGEGSDLVDKAFSMLGDLSEMFGVRMPERKGRASTTRAVEVSATSRSPRRAEATSKGTATAAKKASASTKKAAKKAAAAPAKKAPAKKAPAKKAPAKKAPATKNAPAKASADKGAGKAAGAKKAAKKSTAKKAAKKSPANKSGASADRSSSGEGSARR